MTIKAKKSKINLREKLAELLNFRQIRDRLDGLGLYLGKDRTGTAENLAVRGGASIDDLQLAEISAALGGTAVDVFVYDTRRDSDGGAWRGRTQHTSWYNEELNTATRGGRREFPAVAVIVAEAGKVTIYDGDDPDLSMWMVFGDNLFSTAISSVYIVNGNFCCGTDGSLRSINFVEDKIGRYSAGDLGHWGNSISARGESLYGFVRDYSVTIINNTINDVAMTVLPNAPIDAETGLPVPTIAVATDGGVSVIRDDGSVVDITCSNTSFVYSYYVVFDKLNRLFFSLDGQGNKRRVFGLNNIPATDLIVTTDINEKQNGDIFIADDNGFGTATKDMFLFNQSSPQVAGFASDNSIGTDQGLFKAFINKEDSSKSLYNYTTSSYNTGWMPGDIKLATLSDTKNETVGVDESTELLVDGSGNWIGDFDVTTDVDAWIDQSTGTQSVDSSNVSSGVLTLTRSASDSEQISKLLNVEAGKKYKLTFDITATTNNKGQIWIGVDLPSENQLVDGTYTAESILNTGNALGVGSYEYIFTAESTTYLTIRCGGDDTLSYDNISVKQTGELITNGTFDDGTVGWTGLSGGVLSIDNGRLKIEETTNAVDAYAVNSSAIPTVVGKKYIITWQFIKGTNTGFSTRFGNSGDQTYDYKGNVSEEYTDDGYYSFEFTATASELNLSFIVNNANSYGFVDNVSVRLAEPDRSVNDNGLQIFGTIDKTPVAPGADLVAYSGFSADNYLMQPYNSDLEFGTGDFCVMGWARSSGASQAYISVGPESGTGARIISGVDSGNRWFFTAYDNTDSNTTRYLSRDLSTYSTSYDWVHIVAGRKDGVFFFYFNNKEMPDENNTATDSKDLTNTNSTEVELKIGVNWQKTAGGGELALVRISKTAPTPEQIAKIYRDEKALFQDGAQATLYGTSDAVTALAYDDKTELLHVGTSGGRSDFAGLRRINNTTTAVTTSISASNNLIAEQ